MPGLRIHVVAAVIENQQGQVFIAKRPSHVHQGNLWEFPGGKVENDESATQALRRELFEEIGIHVQEAEPLIQISHDYPDKSVLLDVYRVKYFNGKAHGKEGQQTRWISKSEFDQFEFPAANKAILNAAVLPQYYLITPEPDLNQKNTFLENIEHRLKSGITLIQLRAKRLDPQQLKTLFLEVREINQPYNASLLINSSVKFAENIGAQGVHLSSTELMNTISRPKDLLCSASCHSESEIITAAQLNLDFVVISPVLKTTTHPGSASLGWEKFGNLCRNSPIPVFALGGMELEHLPRAIQSGAQGIAGIRSLWCKTLQNSV